MRSRWSPWWIPVGALVATTVVGACASTTPVTSGTGATTLGTSTSNGAGGQGSSAASGTGGAGGSTSSSAGGGGSAGSSSTAGGGGSAGSSSTAGGGGSAGSSSSSASSGGGGSGGGTCFGDPGCACPASGPIAGYAEHDGLRSIDPGHFALVDQQLWATQAAQIDALGLPKVAPEALVLNRTGTKPDAALAADLGSVVGYQGAFEWEAGDQNVSYWVPQGISGATAGAREYVVVSWHYDEAHLADDPNPPASGDKGVRVSFANVKALGGDVPYRHLLLVEPDAAKGFVSVNIHAGGLAWFGPYLYVADTSRGLRVFDTTRIVATSTSAACSSNIGKVGAEVCAYGYAQALPQVGAYFYPAGTEASCKAKFSYLSLDTTTDPPSLLSGEYDNDPALGIYSRILRFALDPQTHHLETNGAGAAIPEEAFYAGNRNVQGVASVAGKFFLSATRYSGSLFTGQVGDASKVYKASTGAWAWMTEGVYHLPSSGRLFVNTEGHANMPRIVFATKASAIP